MELTLRKWKKNRKNISQKISVQNEPPHFEHLFSFKRLLNPSLFFLSSSNDT